MTDRQVEQSRRPFGMKAPCDGLRHKDFAHAVAGHITGRPPGSVISVQGPWGRGKTDVLTRVFDLFDERAQAGDRPQPLWLDPWQYGTPDLIRPVVTELLDRMRTRGKASERLRLAAKTLLLASNAMVFKALTLAAPFGAALGAAQPAVDDVIRDLLTPDDQRPIADADPVKAMAKRFHDLVDEFLSPTGRSSAPLLICVDDLDRCLPDHQIAMLESIHFLTSAGANCSFLVALDPVLVQQAAAAHYRTDVFDSNQYLDKLFQLRVNLTALQPDAIEALVDAELSGANDQDRASTVESVFGKGLGVGPGEVKAAFGYVFFVPELTNPRLVHRVFERLRLAANANVSAGHAELRDPDVLDGLVAWCAIAERWPQLRQVLQASPNELWPVNLRAICGFYGIWDDDAAVTDEKARAIVLAEAASVTSRLPGQHRQPDLGSFISARVLSYPSATLRRIDDVLVTFGL
jgi:KAP family P-loop domain